jgi:hypothetical protein
MKTPGRRQATSGVGEQLNLIEPPPFSPRWPKRSSLSGRALSELLRGHHLKHLDFIGTTGSWRLAEPIRKLRHDYGWPVETLEIPSPTAENPGRIIGEYLLPTWVLDSVDATHG